MQSDQPPRIHYLGITPELERAALSEGFCPYCRRRLTQPSPGYGYAADRAECTGCPTPIWEGKQPPTNRTWDLSAYR
jgi:hypothetical protein